MNRDSFVRTPEFDNLYAYTGNDLGVSYTKEKCLFKLWAPTATKVILKLNSELYELNCEVKGIWSISIGRDLEGAYYSYLLCIDHHWREAIDPYTIALSANSENGVIIDLKKTIQCKSSQLPYINFLDAIIYEMHVRDFTIDENSGVKHRGKYLGLTELHTISKDGTFTGLSHLLDLGVTHIQLMPINDFAGIDELSPHMSYNWGYNPLFFNVPEGSYSINPQDPYNRINELKRMINELHDHGIRVILDVVYNHVYIHHQSSFEKIVPGYFFRYGLNGSLADGTGVGNDFASERFMARKFIVDSIKYWLSEFSVDGFRFDLMGILDINTMKEIQSEAIKINPSVLLYGEGWDLPTPLSVNEKAIIVNSSKIPGVGFFNDQFRDFFKGSTFTLEDKGFSLGNAVHPEMFIERVAGSIGYFNQHDGLFQEPTQSINYVESHDNHTFWDKLLVSNKGESLDVLRKRQKLATAITLLSQGIPFLHCGQEFYRTKYGVENSYQSSDIINMIDWSRKSEFSKDVEYVKGLIAIRKFHGAFRLTTSSLIRKHLHLLSFPEGVIGFQLSDVSEFGPSNEIIAIFNNSSDYKKIVLKENKKWNVLCENDVASVIPLYEFAKNEIIMYPISTLVLFQK